MSSVVVDTHAIVWYLAGDARLSSRAAATLDLATSNSGVIFVPSICLVELTYLVEKGRIPSTARERLVAAIDDPATACRLAPLDRTVADAMTLVRREDVPDLPDRIVAATAIASALPLISRDAKIRLSHAQIIW